MRRKIQLRLDPEGRISGLAIPSMQVKANLKDTDGTVEFYGDPQYLQMVMGLLSQSFTSWKKTNPVKQFESGLIFVRSTDWTNATVILYTVPPTRTFYLFGLDFNCRPNDVSFQIDSNTGYLYAPEAIDEDFQMIQGIAATLNVHTFASFNGLPLPAGAQLRGYADINSMSAAVVIGVLL